MGIKENLLVNPWDNAYWFARMLIDSDKYGGIGKNSQKMLSVANGIKSLLSSIEFLKNDTETQYKTLCDTVRDTLLQNKKAGRSYDAVVNLCNDMFDLMETTRDFEVLALTCEKVMVPINKALDAIPSDDSEFVVSVGKALLEAKGAKGLSNIINVLDEIGSKGCIAAERSEIVQAFGDVRKLLSQMLNSEEMDIVLTAFCQEFERRAGQKRKGRAGRGVEGTTSIILDYFGIKTAHEPEHFTTGLEIDKWIKTKDGWIIGISCKRTLRERWKQAYTTNLDLLNRHKIRQLWHVITFDRDLSDDKITEMGSYRAIFYLPDDSTRLKNALRHPGMKDYVRPMTRFIDDLKALV